MTSRWLLNIKVDNIRVVWIVESIDSLDKQLATIEGPGDEVGKTEGRGDKMDEVSGGKEHFKFDEWEEKIWGKRGESGEKGDSGGDKVRENSLAI